MNHTKQQRQAQMVSFAYFREYFTAREYCKAVKISASGRVYKMLDELVNAGWLACAHQEGRGAIKVRKLYYMEIDVRNRLASLSKVRNEMVWRTWIAYQEGEIV